MSRRPRGTIVHSFAHVTSKGIRGLPIYFCDAEYEWFLARLEEYAKHYGIRLHAFCLLTNHFHLLLEAGPQPISKFMHRLLYRYARHINRRHQHFGHLFADRFWAKPCDRDVYLLGTIRYIHRNPVLAGLSKTPEGYRWSSHSVYLGAQALPWVATDSLAYFHQDRQRAVEAYARFVWPEGQTAEGTQTS